jgi:predicted DNA-binding transcriptional regulator AlpA
LQGLVAQIEALKTELVARKLALQSLQAKIEAVQRSNQPRLHVKDVLRLYGISKVTLYRRLRRGRFPRPFRFAGPLWRLDDLERAETTGQIQRPPSR